MARRRRLALNRWRPHRHPRPVVAGAVALLGLTGLVASCAQQEAPAAPSGDTELVLGRDIYVGNCQSCHGGTGQGGRGAKLNEGSVLERFSGADEQAALIAEGVRSMPGFEDKLTAEELAAVVRYTREIIAVTGAE